MIDRQNLRPPSYGRVGAIVAALLTFSLLLACDEVLSPELEFAAAQQAVERWVEQHPSGWSLNLQTSRPLTRPEWSEPCVNDPASGFTTLRHAAVDTEIDLLFQCPVSADAGVEELAEALYSVVLNELPHGIRSSGWRFRLLTPSTDVRETVTLSSPTDGRLLVEIQTPLFAIYGHSTRQVCEPKEDAGSAEGCYLKREHRVPLSLSLEVPRPGSLAN